MAPQFWMEQASEGDASLRLSLFGELDLNVADQLEARLKELKAAGANVHLDLSELTFIDSSGIRVVTRARLDASRSGWPFDIDPHVSEVVRRPLELLGLDEVLWSKTPD